MDSTRASSLATVYDYTLRCALRACLEQTSNLRPASFSSSISRRSAHFHDMFGSLSERFGDGGDKTDKLTREVVRALLRRLDDITKGQHYERDFITMVALIQKHIQLYRFRPTGTIEDLVLAFSKLTETELKKENSNSSSVIMEKYVAQFASILKQTVLEDVPSYATPELIDTLDGFMGQPRQQQRVDSKRASGGPILVYGSVESFEQFPMVKTVQTLFQVDPQEHKQKLRELHPLCTQSAFMHDLKQCINNIDRPSKANEFPNQHSYDAWQKREMKQLTELLKTLTLLDPTLSTAGDDMDARSHKAGFTFIPEDPRGAFHLLMTLCLDQDMNTPDAERVKTSVLSQASDELLRECWRTWRLSAPFRTLLYLDLVKQRFDCNVFTMDDIKDATRMLDRALKENSIMDWTLADRASLIRIYEEMERTFSMALIDSLSQYWKASPEWIHDVDSLLGRIYQDPLYRQTHPQIQVPNLVETVECAAVERWRSLETDCTKDDDDLSNLLMLADKLTKELVSLATKKYKSPIQGVSIPGIVMTIQMPYFALEMENWAYLPTAQEAPIEVTFHLYHKVLSLKRLYDQHGPQQKTSLFKVESWFLSHVRRWLRTTDAATPEWVENAIKQDNFRPTHSLSMHSSSIVDLFSLFHQAVDFVQKLQWPNEYQHCRFMTALSKVIGVALTQYTNALEERISHDIVPPSFHSADHDGSFLRKAKLQLTGNRTMRPDTIPDDFTPELCAKINDIEAAKSRLDRLYQRMDVDAIANYLRENDTAPLEQDNHHASFLYSIKAVRAENLQPLDSNGLSDPYVIFDMDGKRIGRTHTVYETLNPRWEHQTFDVWLGGETVSVLAMVYDEDLWTSHEECGGAWFKLSPDYFNDYQSHDVVLDLHPQGKLVLRITMEGEKDDIHFWFGKAFRILKRAENDAAGLLVDRMSRYIRHCLSRKVLDKLLGHDRSFFSSFGRNSGSSKQATEPDLQGCEDAIVPLLDYLERNLKILNDHLSETNMHLVIGKIWKEVLVALESTLLPPLSEHHSDMKPLDDYEFHVVYKWLELLKVLFNGGEDCDAVPLDRLESSQYYALLAINVAYNLETEQLKEIYHAAVRNQAELKQRGGRKADRSKSVYQSKNTARKKTPKHETTSSIDLPSSDVVLRILRMRSGKAVRDFLREEFVKRSNPAPPLPPPHAVAAEATRLDDHPLPPLPPLPTVPDHPFNSSSPAPPPVPAHHV